MIFSFLSVNRDESSSSDSSSDEDENKPADDETKDDIPLASFVVNIDDEKKEEKDAESVM